VKKFVQLRIWLFEIDLYIEVDLKILETSEPKGTSFNVQRTSRSKAYSALDGFGGSRCDDTNIHLTRGTFLISTEIWQ